MSLIEIKTKADNWLESFSDQILSPQEQFFDASGVYWIGVSTPMPHPSDGELKNTNLNESAPGMPSWSGFGLTLPTQLDFAVRVDAIRKVPDCFAFDIVAEISWSGAAYVKTYTYHHEWIKGDWVQIGPFA